MEDVNQIWARYHRDRDDESRNELFARYLSLAAQTAASFSRGRNAVDREDIAAEARLALLRAIQGWDPQKGSDPDQFLRFKVRVGVVNHLRAMGWVGKSVRQKARQLADAEEALSARNGGRRPTDEETAEYLGLDVDELAQVRSKVSRTAWQVSSLDAPPAGTEVGSWHDSIADANQPGPEEELAAGERSKNLASILARLSPVSREILTRRHLNGEPSKSIAKSLGVHESRVSQLHEVALAEARELAHRRVLSL